MEAGVKRAIALLVVAFAWVAWQAEARPPAPIFVFKTDEFWLNLHHFLSVLGRAANKTADASERSCRRRSIRTRPRVVDGAGADRLARSRRRVQRRTEQE